MLDASNETNDHKYQPRNTRLDKKNYFTQIDSGDKKITIDGHLEGSNRFWNSIAIINRKLSVEIIVFVVVVVRRNHLDNFMKCNETILFLIIQYHEILTLF